MENEVIYGKNAVYEALKNKVRQIEKILIAENHALDSRIYKIKQLASSQGIPVQLVPKERLNKYHCDHQGILAFISPVMYEDLDEFLQTESPKLRTLVILDGIEDPHNFGAVIRTAVCAGVDGIIIRSHRACPVNSTVEKISAGAINHIKLFKVNSLSATVDKLKINNWWIIATDPCANDNYFEIDTTSVNLAIILGSEAKGISKTLENKADFKVKIPILSDFNSLNVSNAFSVVIYETLRQKIQKSQIIV